MIMKFLKTFGIFLAIILVIFSSIPIPQTQAASATPGQPGFTVVDQICNPDTSTVGSGNNLGNCVNNIYVFAISIAGFLAVLMFVFAGYLYITGGSENLTTAKSIITSTIVALVLLFATYAILNTINPNLTTLSGLDLSAVHCEKTSNF